MITKLERHQEPHDSAGTQHITPQQRLKKQQPKHRLRPNYKPRPPGVGALIFLQKKLRPEYKRLYTISLEIIISTILYMYLNDLCQLIMP